MTNIQKIIEDFQTFVATNDLYMRGYPVGKLESFLLSALQEVRQETLEEEIKHHKKQIKIHNHIIDSNDVLPLDWHKGRIIEAEENVERLKLIQSKKENI